MAGTILTPNAIWKDFFIDGAVASEIKDERTENGVIITRLYLDGRKTADGQVKIFGVMAKSAQISLSPAILLVQNFEDGTDERIVVDLAKRGYTVLSVDLEGKKEGKADYTVYPDSVSYADYRNVKDSLMKVEGDACDTCWYEWTCAARYALKFLKDLPEVTSVGGFGIADAATVLWQVAGTDELLDCAVFALNAGWGGYRGIYKFGGKVEPQFSDDMYKYIAGIEPQSYAMHVKCPVLMLSATNSNVYDCDRAYDTVSRIKEDVYKAVHYSVGYRERISGEAYRNAVIFFGEFLMRGKTENPVVPKELDIKCEVTGGKVVAEVATESENLAEISLYVAEEAADPAVRCWRRVTEYSKTEEGKFVFDYSPYPLSGLVTMFAQARYKSGFTVCSNIIGKRFAEEEITFEYKDYIIYSSRTKDAESVLCAANQTGDYPNHVNINDRKRIVVKKGPISIEGATCEWGILTFKVGAQKYKPKDDAMLMLDVYVKEDGVFTVKLISDYFGAKTEYVASVKLIGGDVWHNVQLDRVKFKTAEGMSLKSYEKINAVEFNADGGEYLINNALWV